MSATNVPPDRRRLIGRAGATKQWSEIPHAGRAAATQAGRDGWLAKLADQIDPDHKLDDDERMQLARQARRAHMQAMAAQRMARRRAAASTDHAAQ